MINRVFTFPSLLTFDLSMILQAQGLYTQLVPTLALYGILVQKSLKLLQFCINSM